MNILILAGGLSPEREVSFTSGCRIATALIGRGHRVCLCDPTQDAIRTENRLSIRRTQSVRAASE